MRSAARFGKITSLNRDYIRLRMMKSAEELDWLRIGAHFSDLGMAALREGLRPGLAEQTQAGQPLLYRNLSLIPDGVENALPDGSAEDRVAVQVACREPLGVPGETTWRVAPLSLPPHARPVDVDSLLESAAVRLFVDRARSALVLHSTCSL